MVTAENRPFIVDPGSEAALAGALVQLAGDPALRAQIGAANRQRAVAEYDEATMLATYAAVYREASGRSRFP